MNIGKAIKSIRIKFDLSQGELAERIGISQTALSQIETGNSQPSKKTMEKIAATLEIPQAMIYILGIDDGDVPEAKKELYQKLFPTLKNLALDLLSP